VVRVRFGSIVLDLGWDGSMSLTWTDVSSGYISVFSVYEYMNRV
jgi:hypothetical protein